MYQPWQQLRKLIAPVFVFSLRQVCKACQSLPDSWIKFPFQQRQQRVPHTVACVAGIEIGGVLAPWLSQSFEADFNFHAARGQQGPNQVLRFLRWSNAGQATCAGSRSEERRVGKECRSRWSP